MRVLATQLKVWLDRKEDERGVDWGKSLDVQI